MNTATQYSTLSPRELKRLVETSSWVFEQAYIKSENKDVRAPDLYLDLMQLVGSSDAEQRGVAIAKFSEFLEAAPVFAEGHFQLSRLYLQQGDYEQSLKFARNAATMMPENVAYQVLLIAALAASGLTDEARAAIENCNTLFPATKVSAEADYISAFLGAHLERVLPGYVYFDNELQPVAVWLGRILDNLASPNESQAASALFNLRTLVRTHPALNEARFWLAEYQRRHGDWRDALEICEEGRRIQVPDWPLLVVTGLLLWRDGRKNPALLCFEEAALINHDLPIFSPQHIDENSAAKLVAWYDSILVELPIKAGAYGAGWRLDSAPVLHASVPRNTRSRWSLIREAWSDLLGSIKRAPAWWLLARNDLTARYRRTALGPWWVVMSSAIALVGMAAVWSFIFNMDMANLFPYLSAGYAIWLLLNSIIVEGCGVFTDGQSAMIQKNLDLPRFLHVFRLVTRSFLFFAHTLAIFVVGAFVYEVDLTPYTLLAIPGLILLYLNALWLVMLVGVIGARFRDFAPAASAFMTVAFFLTPVLWKTEMLRERAHLAEINPFTHLISIVREPLLGMNASPLSWSVAIVLCLAGWCVTFAVFSWFRQRIVFWL